MPDHLALPPLSAHPGLVPEDAASEELSLPSVHQDQPGTGPDTKEPGLELVTPGESVDSDSPA